MTTRPRLHHVSIPRPPGSEAETRAFYGELLGLQEIPVPKSLQYLKLIWFSLGGVTELHTFTEEPFEDPSKRHLCLEVDDPEATREKLVAAGYAPWDTTIVPGRPRFFCHDPFKNSIEFTVIEGNYLELE